MDNYINLWMIEIPTGNDIAKTIASEIETLIAKVAIDMGFLKTLFCQDYLKYGVTLSRKLSLI